MFFLLLIFFVFLYFDTLLFSVHLLCNRAYIHIVHSHSRHSSLRRRIFCASQTDRPMKDESKLWIKLNWINIAHNSINVSQVQRQESPCDVSLFDFCLVDAVGKCPVRKKATQANLRKIDPRTCGARSLWVCTAAVNSSTFGIGSDGEAYH